MVKALQSSRKLWPYTGHLMAYLTVTIKWNYPKWSVWKQSKEIPSPQMLSLKTYNIQWNTSIMSITTCNRANPNLKVIISKHCPFLGRSSATRNLEKDNNIISQRTYTSLKAMLVRAKNP